MTHIARIRLGRFGVLADTAVELAPGLTVVFGVNEAGKSTLLDAVDAVLCGLPSRSVHGVPPSDLRVEVDVVDGEGGAARSYRRSPAGLLELPALSLVASPWDPALATTGAWRARLGLNHVELVAGGTELFAGGTDLADVIFAAHEGFSARALREQLQERADSLFRRRRNASSGVRVLLAELAEAEDRLRVATVDPHQLEMLAADVLRLQRDQDEAYAALQQARGQVRRCERDEVAAEHLAELRQARIALDALDLSTVLPPADAELAIQALAALEELDEELAELLDEIASLVSDVADVQVDDALLAAGAGVAAVFAQRGAAMAAREDAAARRLAAAGAQEAVAAGLRSLGLLVDAADGAAVAEAAAAVLLGADVVDGLDAAATDVAQATAALRDGRDVVEAVRNRLAEHASTVAGGSTEPAADSLTQARRIRDQAWADVLDAVRAGDAAVATMAAAPFVAAQAGADDAADRAIARAQVDAQRAALDRELDRADEAAARRAGLLDEVTATWSARAASAGLPAAVTPDGWPTRRRLLADLGIDVTRWQEAAARAAAAERTWVQFAAETEQVAAPLGLDGDAADQAAALHERLLAARESRTLRDDRVERLARLRVQEVELTARRTSAVGELDGLARRHGLDTVADLVARIGHTDAVAKAMQREREALAPLLLAFRDDAAVDDAALDEAAVDDAVERLADVDPDDLAEATARARAVADEREDEYQAARDARRERADELAVAAASDVEAAAAQHVANLRSRLAELVDDYVRTRIELRLLDDRLAGLLAQHGSHAVARAGELLEQLTGGRYVALRTAEAPSGRRSLSVVAADWTPVELHQLSEGTADQVFLALRLAGLEARHHEQVAAGHVPLPIVLDDILLAFDDDRTARVLDCLVEWADGLQVVLTTHHAAVAASARSRGIACVDLPAPRPIERADVAAIRAATAAPTVDPGGEHAPDLAPGTTLTKAELSDLVGAWWVEQGNPPPQKIGSRMKREFIAAHPQYQAG